MSVSLASCESLITLVEQHYNPNMPLYFCEDHLTTLTNLLLATSQDPKQGMHVVWTDQILYEPIISTEPHDHVEISISMIASLVNLYVPLTDSSIEFVDRVNLFEPVSICPPAKPSNLPPTIYGCSRRRKRIHHCRADELSDDERSRDEDEETDDDETHTDDTDTDNNYYGETHDGQPIEEVEDYDYKDGSFCRRKRKKRNEVDLARVTSEDVVRYTHVIRLAVTAAHYWLHRQENEPFFRDHNEPTCRLPAYEFAVRKPSLRKR